MATLLCSLCLYGAISAADITTTVAGLNQGLTEANPVFRPMQDRRVVLTAVNVGSTAGTMYLLHTVERKHRTAGRILAWTLIGIRGYVVGRNLAKLR